MIYIILYNITHTHTHTFPAGKKCKTVTFKQETPEKEETVKKGADPAEVVKGSRHPAEVVQGSRYPVDQTSRGKHHHQAATLYNSQLSCPPSGETDVSAAKAKAKAIHPQPKLRNMISMQV